MLEYYYLKTLSQGCACRVRVNGFPVSSSTGRGRAPLKDMAMINHLLVGQDNVLRVELDLVGPGRGAPSPDLRVAVEAYSKGEGVGPEPGGRSVAEIGPEHTADLEFPAQIELRFDTPGSSYAKRLTEGDVVTDVEALPALAEQLRGLLAAGDRARIVELFRPKLECYAAAYGQDQTRYMHDFQAFLGARLRPDTLLLDFTATDVEPLEHCGGRVWELCLRGGPLIRTAPDKDGRSVAIPVYVGVAEGGLAVVQ